MAEVIPFRAPFSDAGYCAEYIVARLDESEIDFDQPQFRERLRDRDISMRQVLSTLRKGEVTDGPRRDVHGDFRVKLKCYVAGRKIQVVVALNVSKFTVVTVI